MMSCTVSEYFELNGAVGFSKEYDGGKYKFTAFLPNEKTDVFEFIDGLCAEDLIAALNKAENESVKIEMPKFSFDYDLDLIPPLSSLGISDLFGPADFSEMAEVGVGDLYVDMAIHKTHIDLDENGTKAAAATYISTRKNAAMYDHEITLDRPFVYMIIDSETNLPIFMGVVAELK